jgi:hypothetical protein
MIYHVLNRGNGRLRLFHKEGDYDAFEQVLIEGLKRYPVALLTYCLMPNHWHLGGVKRGHHCYRPFERRRSLGDMHVNA